MTIVCATSDFHGHLPEIPECDLLLIAGDICPATNHRSQFQARWLRNEFSSWLDDVWENTGCKEIIGICGNHDIIGEKEPDVLRRLKWTYLEDNEYEYDGLKIWGSPWTKEFGVGWAFNKTAEELAALHQTIPADTDIIITHGPPYGFGDLLPRDMEHVGSPELTVFIAAIEPLLTVFGHIHCAQGTRKLGKATIANVAYVDEKYRPYYPPQIFEV